MSDRARDVIVIGPPGSGKGTQAERLAERLGAEHVNAGALMRELAAGDSPLGEQVRNLMTRGDLVPDEVVDQAVRERLEGLADERPAILDGYPRNVTQAERLHRTLGDLGRLEPPPAVVRLDVPREALLERLSRRREIEGRADDTDEGARRRLEVYDEETAPVPAAMAGWTDALEIEGDQPPDAVTEEILDRLHGGR